MITKRSNAFNEIACTEYIHTPRALNMGQNNEWLQKEEEKEEEKHMKLYYSENDNRLLFVYFFKCLFLN